MRHARAAALQGLSELLDQIRSRSELKEKTIGVFYVRSKSLLHFHEDAAGMFGDLSVEDGFDRYPVNTKQQWKVLLAAIDRELLRRRSRGSSG